MKVGKAIVVLIGCSFIAACGDASGDTEVISKLKASELHVGSGNCGDGPTLRFINDRLVTKEGGGKSRDYPASIKEIGGYAVLEFGDEPVQIQWTLKPTSAKDTFAIDSHFKNPMSDDEKQYYKQATGKSPEQVNQMWNSLQTVTACAPK